MPHPPRSPSRLTSPPTKSYRPYGGLFFEDINLSADGGLYAELARNRSFEDSDELQHWQLVNTGDARAATTVTCEQPWTENPLNTRNKRSLRIDIAEA